MDAGLGLLTVVVLLRTLGLGLVVFLTLELGDAFVVAVKANLRF